MYISLHLVYNNNNKKSGPERTADVERIAADDELEAALTDRDNRRKDSKGDEGA
jgi:hypothetical protein